MTFSAASSSIAGYRERTDKNAGKMEGACFLTFLCRKCGQKKPTKGRKSIGWKAGFKCAECASK